MAIHYFSEDTSFKPKKRTILSKWIRSEIELRSLTSGSLNFVFCSDEYLLELNKRYLDHDYYTDILTFPGSKTDSISGELFLSIDRIRENAETHNFSFTDELHRVMIHGILHLCGYNDHSEKEIAEIRIAEKEALERLERYLCG